MSRAVAAPGGGHGGANAPPVRGFAPHLPPPVRMGFFFFFFFTFFFFLTYVFFTYVLSGRYRPLLQKVAKCKKYNKFKDFAFNTLAFQKVTNMTFKYSNFRALKSVNPKSSGAPPPGPPAGALPLHPARGPKAGPWTPPKIDSRLRARYVRSAHMFAPKKNRTPAIQKNRLALRARYVRYAHWPPIINHCPLLAPPLSKSWCRHWSRGSLLHMMRGRKWVPYRELEWK